MVRKKKRYFYSQVQKDYPTELPGDQSIIDWLDNFTEGLLDVIKGLVHDNDAVNYYLQKEGEIPRMLYEKMYYRLTYIERLTSD